MLFQAFLSLALAASPLTQALAVAGTAPGFAAGTTGGAAGKVVTPSTTAELAKYLTSKDALTIVLTKTFDFTGTEGTASETGCAPWGTGSKCQLAINANNWCKNYQGSAPSVKVSYDKAATNPIKVQSNKSIIGSGSAGVIKGKGLYLSGGVSNIIIQNIHITGLNPKYVWGGDAITLNGCSKVWIDHVKISLIGRMMIVAGYETNTKITISNSEFDGKTSWSATCDSKHYWGLYLTGKNDQITLSGNYIHDTTGRSPKVDEGTLLHAVDNYWAANTGHAFEGSSSYILVEGNIFDNVKTIVQDFKGSMYAAASSDSACKSALGRNCAANTFKSSGTVSAKTTSVLSKFKGLKVAKSAGASGVPSRAGVGKLKKRNLARTAGQWRL